MNLTRNERNGALLVLGSVSCYAMLPVFIKELQNVGLNSLDIATWRFLLAVPLFWLMVKLLRLPAGDRPLPRVKLLLMGTLLAMGAVGTFWGFERIPAGTFTVLFYTYPMMVAVLSVFLGERLPLVGWIALVLTSIGIILTVPDFGQGVGNNNLVGVLLALFTAFVVAIYFILSGRVLKGHTALGAASAWTTSGALMLLLILIPIRALQMPGSWVGNVSQIVTSLPALAAVQPDGAGIWLRLLSVAGLSTVIGGFLLTIGIQRVGPARASIIGTVEPILTLIFARIFLGEQMQPFQVVGGAFIVASVIVLQFGNRPKTALVEAQVNNK